MIRISAGTAIIYNSKILLCHPTKLPWENSFSLPKGGVDDGETILQAALRETLEEVGIVIREDQISNLDNPIEVIYTNKKGDIFKKVFVFIVRINSLSEIGIENELLDRETLQASEVDWASFMTKDEARNKIFYRFKHLFDLI